MNNSLYITRIRMGLTQKELAERAGISRRTICYLEGGGRMPTIRVGLQICCALGCGLEEVFPIYVLL